MIRHPAGLLVAALILLPLAAPGYVLSYDMNFVPEQSLHWDLIAPTDSSPRAVPLDAAVSLSNTVIPGWLLQRLALLGIIWAAVVGAYRLVPPIVAPAGRLTTGADGASEAGGSVARLATGAARAAGRRETLVRLVAGVAYGWTPFLAERLLLGQWGLLLAYAALPWLVMACIALRRGAGSIPVIILALGVSALTPTGGLIAAATAIVMTAGRPWRRFAAVTAAAGVLNAPWLVAALITTASSHSDPGGVAAFATRGENWGGPMLALLGTGGVWNAETAPASRASALIPLVTVALLAAAGAGLGPVSRALGKRFAMVAAAGLGLAALSTVPFGVSALVWLVENVPGAGILRDSQKFALPYALLFATCLAVGAQRIAARLKDGQLLLAAALIVPVLSMPDLAYGGAGALRPVHYPADWEQVRALVQADPGPLLSLPLSAYRRYEWNRDRVVLDVAPRYLPVAVSTDDTLHVGDLVIGGESGKSHDPRRFRWILVQGDAPIQSGLDQVYSGRYLSLYRNPDPLPPMPLRPSSWPIIAAELLALVIVASATATLARKLTRW